MSWLGVIKYFLFHWNAGKATGISKWVQVHINKINTILSSLSVTNYVINFVIRNTSDSNSNVVISCFLINSQIGRAIMCKSDIKTSENSSLFQTIHFCILFKENSD